MLYSIEISAAALDELRSVRKFDRVQIIAAIEEQLKYEPTTQTKNRKILIGIEPQFEHVPPIWEIRIGEYRVFYDVNDDGKKVLIRAVRNKPPHATTEQVI